MKQMLCGNWAMFSLIPTTYNFIIMNIMKVLIASFIILLTTFGGSPYAQQTQNQAQSIAQGLGLYVFPTKGQDKDQQNKDEMECYKWAIQQTGYDPLNPPEIKAKEADRSLNGQGLVGGAKGAAAGAAIGAIAGDAGQGAAIGAVVGGLSGRRARLRGDQMEQMHNEQAAAAKSQELMNNYKKAFSACMEGKGYTIK